MTEASFPSRTVIRVEGMVGDVTQLHRDPEVLWKMQAWGRYFCSLACPLVPGHISYISTGKQGICESSVSPGLLARSPFAGVQSRSALPRSSSVLPLCWLLPLTSGPCYSPLPSRSSCFCCIAQPFPCASIYLIICLFDCSFPGVSLPCDYTTTLLEIPFQLSPTGNFTSALSTIFQTGNLS